ncbi:hypothetical protein EJ05DRAFT_500753 [Pseudovirgaria hyperparasitica]|uniref:Uncharacterized protein n=1 Tax=Pseudovirgaria hyperparasitica TaxID=470096 RepID=A0A6A6W8L6_9PEZI|nr:uncharacterized protein EJ05DRAFT_500753 [Pseudovirgaria hyperparasitica]KAF2758236.1 hypothetical protein EJ05DRAFT_500753 [Pseudovirgaria hyperparasitica]
MQSTREFTPQREIRHSAFRLYTPGLIYEDLFLDSAAGAMLLLPFINSLAISILALLWFAGFLSFGGNLLSDYVMIFNLEFFSSPSPRNKRPKGMLGRIKISEYGVLALL